MGWNDYHFITRWQLPGDIRHVADILNEPLELTRWWPAVYLDVQELDPGDENHIGRVIELYTKGWLPYTLRWRFTVTEVDYPTRFAIVAQGDFVGVGVWTLEQREAGVETVYDWRIRADKALLRYLSPVIKPIFAANHRWAMRQGYGSILLELRRRRATSDQERSQIPAPPGPTFVRSSGLR